MNSVSERSEGTRGCLFAKKNIAMQCACGSGNLVHGERQREREKSTQRQSTELNTERQRKGSRTMKASRAEWRLKLCH